MRHSYFGALFVSVTLLAPSPATAQAPDAKPDLGANAAMKYWKAFGLLPTLDKDQQKLLEDCNKVPLDAAALKLIDNSSMSRLYLHRGAKLQRCDWGLELDDGLRLVLPHIPKAATLARLAVLNARHEFDKGHGKAGWEDVMAVLTLARHFEQDRLMIIQMLGYRIEETALEAVAPYLPKLKQALPKSAAKLLDALPARPTLAQMLLAEKQVGPVWLIQELKDADQRSKGSWRDVLKELFDHPESEDRDLAKSIKSVEEAVKMLEDVLPFYDQMAKLTALPRKEAEGKYPELLKKALAANPMAHAVFPALDRVIAAEHRIQARTALFRAALTVVQDGPDKLKDIKDPFGDGPFEYKALDKGFELKSKLRFKGQPVTLTVGQGKKQ
jgi:hypothetical protein